MLRTRYDGRVGPRHLSVDSWVTLAIAGAPGTIYCGHALIQRQRTLMGVQRTLGAASWWGYFRMGAVPTVALALCAAVLNVAQ